MRYITGGFFHSSMKETSYGDDDGDDDGEDDDDEDYDEGIAAADDEDDRVSFTDL